MHAISGAYIPSKRFAQTGGSLVVVGLVNVPKVSAEFCWHGVSRCQLNRGHLVCLYHTYCRHVFLSQKPVSQMYQWKLGWVLVSVSKPSPNIVQMGLFSGYTICYYIAGEPVVQM